MGLVERSFSGKIFRPRPEIHIEGDNSLLIVATPWGPRTAARKAVKVIKDYYLSARADMEATSPFNKLACLSPIANELRIAVKLANDSIFNEDNKNEYVSGIELAAVARSGSEAAVVQIGMPYFFLDRAQRYLIPLSGQTDLSTEYSVTSGILPPLPRKILGSDAESDFSVESVHLQPHDRFVMISRTGCPAEILTLGPNERQLDQLSRVCSKDDPELPFWIGVLDF